MTSAHREAPDDPTLSERRAHHLEVLIEPDWLSVARHIIEWAAALKDADVV
jgi:hypothetical protein